MVGCPQAKKLSFQIPLLGGVMEVSETRIGGVNLVKPSVSLTFGNLEWKGEGGGFCLCPAPSQDEAPLGKTGWPCQMH